MSALVVASFWASLCGICSTDDASISPEIVRDLKNATVYITTEVANVKATGSGFVVRAEGDSVYVVTNNHVVMPPKVLQGQPTTRNVIFHSGTAKERSFLAEVAAADSSHDLAVLKIAKVDNPPEAVDLRSEAELLEATTTYSFGFPFGQALSIGKKAPAVTISKGMISSLRSDDEGRIAVVQIDGDLNPGNSGGPVVDSKGRLVGVVVAGIKGSGIGMAIPPHELRGLLAGRVGSDLKVSTVSSDETNASIEVQASLLDPLHRLKSASLHVLRAEELKTDPKPDEKGQHTKLPGARKLDFDTTGPHALAKIDMKNRRKEGVGFQAYWLQVSYASDDGAIHYGAPIRLNLDLLNAGAVALGPPPPEALFASEDDDTHAGDGARPGVALIPAPGFGGMEGMHRRMEAQREGMMRRMDEMRRRSMGRGIGGFRRFP